MAGARFAATRLLITGNISSGIFLGTTRRYLAFSEAVNAFPPRKRLFPRRFPRYSSLIAPELITVRASRLSAFAGRLPVPALAARLPPRAPDLTWPYALAGPGRRGRARAGGHGPGGPGT
jgi:hypothetical protein